MHCSICNKNYIVVIALSSVMICVYIIVSH